MKAGGWLRTVWDVSYVGCESMGRLLPWLWNSRNWDFYWLCDGPMSRAPTEHWHTSTFALVARYGRKITSRPRMKHRVVLPLNHAATSPSHTAACFRAGHLRKFHSFTFVLYRVLWLLPSMVEFSYHLCTEIYCINSTSSLQSWQ